MKPRKCILCMIIGMVLHTACAMTGTDTPPTPPVEQYLNEAIRLEESGDLPGALDQYKLALTADPGNAPAQENSARLSAKLSQMADERYRLGMKYHRQGKYGLARNEFLTALKLQPDHPEAYQMLVSRQPEKTPSYIFHLVKPGESLSMIAKHYYGDFKKYDAIARFNNLNDATLVKPGQRLMIPLIDGAHFKTGTAAAAEDETTYVEHTLQAGESISKLAQRFYGDYKQFHVIAQFNHMEDATRVTVGQKIKIPKIVGLPFYADEVGSAKAQKATVKPVQGMKTSEDLLPVAGSEQPENEQVPEQSETGQSEDEQILAYRQTGIKLLREGNFDDAIFELNKAFEAAPKDSETRKYLAVAYFESGKKLFDQQDFEAARDAFESSLQYDQSCTNCQSYIDKSKIGPLLLHRSKGLGHFEKGEYKLAIAEFEQYVTAKPQDGEVRAYLSKSLFQQAMNDYQKGAFLDAKKGFDSALEYDSACEQCAQYASQSSDRYKEQHYNKGIVYFGKEQLQEAISEWEMVYQLDPAYKDVDQNLKKAKLLQRKLEKIKNASDS